MKLNNKAESFASIIVSIAILWIVMLWVMSIINFNRWELAYYENDINIKLLTENSKEILKNLDTSIIEEDENFYIYKNNTTNKYELIRWQENNNYKYIDRYWNQTNPNDKTKKIYERVLTKKSPIISYTTFPNNLKNNILWLDAKNINSNNNLWILNNSTINNWYNLSHNYNNYLAQNFPYNNLWAKFLDDYLVFSWTEKYLINNDNLITWNNSCLVAPKPFEEKTFSFVFQTSDDIISKWIILEQWNENIWYSFYILNGKFFADIYNNTSNSKYWCSSVEQIYFPSMSRISLELENLVADSMYFITIIHDASSKDNNWEYIDSENTFKLYQNWKLIKQQNWIKAQVEHEWLAIWWSSYSTEWNFKWKIAEILSWNYALTQNELQVINNYLYDKWVNNNLENSNKNNIEITIKKYN